MEGRVGLGTTTVSKQSVLPVSAQLLQSGSRYVTEITVVSCVQTVTSWAIANGVQSHERRTQTSRAASRDANH